MPNVSVVRALTDGQTCAHTHRHTHTDSSVFITSTADKGGKNDEAVFSCKRSSSNMPILPSGSLTFVYWPLLWYHYTKYFDLGDLWPDTGWLSEVWNLTENTMGLPRMQNKKALLWRGLNMVEAYLMIFMLLLFYHLKLYRFSEFGQHTDVISNETIPPHRHKIAPKMEPEQAYSTKNGNILKIYNF